MVPLPAIYESNARIASTLPSGLVAVFVGATSGIGEAALRAFTKRAQRPRIYFVGRREAEGTRIQSELKQLNADGEYSYIKSDVSLLKNVDDVCRQIKSREPAINLLFLSCGTMITGKQTDEDLHYPMALVYYARTRFTVNLLPELRRASSLRRVVTVAAGGKEGPVFTDDFQAKKVGMLSIRGHFTSMVTLSLEAIAKKGPEVSFIHVYPGFVKTGLSRELSGIGPAIAKVVFRPLMAVLEIPIEETGERHLYFSTSARFPPREKDASASGVAAGEDISTAVGADGQPASGVYSIDYKGEGTSQRVQDLMKSLTEDGTAEKIWKNTEEVFTQITGSSSLE